MTIRSRLKVLLAAALLASGAAASMAQAQGDLFAPAVYVNDRVITGYEIEQYKLFLTLLRQPGNVDETAVERLIEDRLRYDAAQAAGITATSEQVEAGMAEFAARANLSTEEFIAAIGQGGVAPETFRSFVEAGLLWREVVRTRFGPRVQITDDEIDRALALAGRDQGIQVLLSEIVLPADTPERRAEAERVAQRLAGQRVSEDAFAAEARSRSASASRARGGRLDWLPAGNLPPAIASQVIGLAPGQVSQPFPTANAVILFYLRDLRETRAPETTALAVDWAEYAVASVEEAERVKAQVDTCDDLYGQALGRPEEILVREVRAAAEVPADVAAELAALDDNEVSTTFSRNGRPVLLMLCARTYELPTPEVPEGEVTETAEGEAPPEAAGPSREQIRNQLFGQRLTAYADGYLAELKADATIRYR